MRYSYCPPTKLRAISNTESDICSLQFVEEILEGDILHATFDGGAKQWWLFFSTPAAPSEGGALPTNFIQPRTQLSQISRGPKPFLEFLWRILNNNNLWGKWSLLQQTPTPSDIMLLSQEWLMLNPKWVFLKIGGLPQKKSLRSPAHSILWIYPSQCMTSNVTPLVCFKLEGEKAWRVTYGSFHGSDLEVTRINSTYIPLPKTQSHSKPPSIFKRV